MVFAIKNIKTILLLALLISFGVPADAQLLKGAGKIVVKSPEVVVIRDGKEKKIGPMGFFIKNGDKVNTGPKGKAQIVMSTGDRIYVGPNATLDISEKTQKRGLARIKSVSLSILGKILAKVRRKPGKEMKIRTTTAIIGVKGTDFIVEHVNNKTTVGTINGLVSMTSMKSGKSLDIPTGKMSSVSPAGDILPMTAFAGRLMKDMEFAGAQMKEDDFSGKKIKMK